MELPFPPYPMSFMDSFPYLKQISPTDLGNTPSGMHGYWETTVIFTSFNTCLNTEYYFENATGIKQKWRNQSVTMLSDYNATLHMLCAKKTPLFHSVIHATSALGCACKLYMYKYVIMHGSQWQRPNEYGQRRCLRHPLAGKILSRPWHQSSRQRCSRHYLCLAIINRYIIHELALLST